MQISPAVLSQELRWLIPYFNLQDELPPDLAEIKINECLTLLDTFDPRVRRILAALHEPGKVDLQKPVGVYLDAGFENLAHFSFAFKKQFGYNVSQVNHLNSNL